MLITRQLILSCPCLVGHAHGADGKGRIDLLVGGAAQHRLASHWTTAWGTSNVPATRRLRIVPHLWLSFSLRGAWLTSSRCILLLTIHSCVLLSLALPQNL
ncbi:hypothetical protein FA95DRAFT_805702 [Auriscalpium vulgare]|uniref:Uncharacterized protein n=1 Tax=Auriscalpium vulgare TaxID=40419 RepID=A0ACB8RAW0_9AGAM|nr:hypothetical protein FA95DRAFT_805702 [Auriscalpium vulgare]